MEGRGEKSEGLERRAKEAVAGGNMKADRKGRRRGVREGRVDRSGGGHEEGEGPRGGHEEGEGPGEGKLWGGKDGREGCPPRNVLTRCSCIYGRCTTS